MKGTDSNSIEKILFQTISVGGKDFLKIDELNAHNSTQMYLDKINIL